MSKTNKETKRISFIKEFVAGFIDIMIMSLIVMVIISLFYKTGIEIPNSLRWVPGIVVISYAFFAHKYKVPSLGNWSLTLQKYSNKLIDRNVGKRGSVKDLNSEIPIGRLVTTTFIIVTLFFLLLVL